jgi:signal transduction histidine kinase
MNPAPPPDLAAALKLFDETTAALASQVQRLESLLSARTRELLEANAKLTHANDELARRLEQLDRLTSWLDLVLSSVASGVIAVDPLGIVTTCNAAAATVLAAEVPDPVGADWCAAFPGSGLADTLRDGQVRRYERSVAGIQGGRRTLACTASPVRSGDGSLLGAVEVFEDVTELRRLHDRLEREDRLRQLGAMAAGVAHEVRNPLNGIQGFASLLARDLTGDDPDTSRRRRWAEAIGTGVRDLDRTVTDLLAFTRSRAPERRAVDPAALVGEVIALVQAEVGDGGPAITLATAWAGGDIAADPAQLRQVLLNLVQNAMHAVVEHDGRSGRGTVRVGIDQTIDSDHRLVLRLQVDDDGPGVPLDLRPHLFTPFHTTRSQGTGLGLAIAHTLISLHGGSLTVDSSDLGGARFVILLPVA